MATLRDLRPGDIGWVTEQHGLHYVLEEGFEPEFEALVAEVVAGILRRADGGLERGWIAVEDGQRVGCVFCTRTSDDIANLRLFYLVPGARGRGMGRHMVETLTEHVRQAGFSRLQIRTHAEHAAACALYRRLGFDLLFSTPVINFGCRLTEQLWEKMLETP